MLFAFLETEDDRRFIEAGYASPTPRPCSQSYNTQKMRDQKFRMFEIVFILLSLAALLYVNYFAYQECFLLFLQISH